MKLNITTLALIAATVYLLCGAFFISQYYKITKEIKKELNTHSTLSDGQWVQNQSDLADASFTVAIVFFVGAAFYYSLVIYNHYFI